MKKSSEAFSLIEMVIVITVSTLLISSIIFTSFFVHYSLLKAKQSSIVLSEMSECFRIITLDILNSDYFIRHISTDYELEKEKIVFYSNGMKVEYEYKEGSFYIRKNNAERKFDFIRKLEIKYYDKNGFMFLPDNIKSGSFPYYCEFNFAFKDNKEKQLKMRL